LLPTNLTTEELGHDGEVTKILRSEYEVYYFDKGPFEKLISRYGVPLSAKERKKQDDELE
jgi:hypothetical protein